MGVRIGNIGNKVEGTHLAFAFVAMVDSLGEFGWMVTRNLVM